MTVAARRWTAAAVAAACASADLLQKALAGDPLLHARSGAAFALMALVGVALLTVVPVFPSRIVAVAAGIAAGGAFGNLFSMVVWSGAVPDPLVVPRVIAFNLADVCVLAGDALLLSAAAVHALRNRPQLFREIR